MKNMTSHTGKLEIIERMPSSRNGNPRYRLRVDGWTCVTQPDAMIAYGIPNLDGKIVQATIGTHYGVATLQHAKEVK